MQEIVLFIDFKNDNLKNLLIQVDSEGIHWSRS